MIILSAAKYFASDSKSFCDILDLLKQKNIDLNQPLKKDQSDTLFSMIINPDNRLPNNAKYAAIEKLLELGVDPKKGPPGIIEIAFNDPDLKKLFTEKGIILEEKQKTYFATEEIFNAFATQEHSAQDIGNSILQTNRAPVPSTSDSKSSSSLEVEKTVASGIEKEKEVPTKEPSVRASKS